LTFPFSPIIAALVLSEMTRRTQNLSIEKRTIAAVSDVMHLKLVARPTGLTPVLGTMQGALPDNRRKLAPFNGMRTKHGRNLNTF